MTRDEYAIGKALADEQGVELPAFEDLRRGGIVGSVELVDCVDMDASPWFFGEWGWVLKDPQEEVFHECKGRLGWFEVDTKKL